MEPHTHHKEEVYIFTKGDGYVVVDGKRYPVGSGDVAFIPPDALHSVVNEAEGELTWAAFCGISWLRATGMAALLKKILTSAVFSTTGDA